MAKQFTQSESEPAQKSVSSSQFVDIPLTNMRAVIAKRLTQSKSTIPHSYVQSVACLDQIMLLRDKFKKNYGLKISINDFVIKACAMGLKLVPELNSIANSDGQSCMMKHNVDISMAVSTSTGLITPIIFSANELKLSDISKVTRNLAEKARAGKLKPHEFQGGTFSISNLGMFGVREFSAIINLPQVAILAVSSGLPRPKHMDESKKIKFSTEMNLVLSIDSRFVDTIKAITFLDYVTNLLSNHSSFLLTKDPVLEARRIPGMDFDEFDEGIFYLNTKSSDLNVQIS